MNIENFEYGKDETNPIMKPPTGMRSGNYYSAPYDRSYMLDDGADGTMKITSNPCKKSCCSEQYPSSMLDKQGKKVKINDKK